MRCVLKVMCTAVFVVAVIATPWLARAQAGGNDGSSYWGQWRGPLATGEAPRGDPPVEWSESSNIRWKVPIPGLGSATPVVWGDRMFVLAAVPAGEEVASSDGIFRRIRNRFTSANSATRVQQFLVLALDRQDGSVIWQQVAREELPHEGIHQTGSYASGSAATDGEVLCAFFGSRGLYCYDLDGEPLWDVDLGDMRIRMGFGEGASPVLHRDLLIVVWDHEGDSFIAAFDKRTGEERWRTPRDEMTSWSTPLVVEEGDDAQVITSATQGIRSYDVATGELRWQDEGVTLNAIPSPVYEDGTVYVTSGYRGNRLAAIDLSAAEGDIAGSDAILWSLDRDTPYVPSPLLHDGLIYLVKSNDGILSSYDAGTGQRVWGPERIRALRGVYASPVSASGRIYVPGRQGTTVVLQAGETFEVLATNELDDGFDASPVVAGDELYLRGREFLYAIAED